LIAENHSGSIVGYYLARPGFKYDQIGPIIAQNTAVAGRLMTECIRNSNGRAVGFDTITTTELWRQTWTTLGFTAVRSSLMMCRGCISTVDSPCCFGLAGAEFG
jgi:hypothetical protein